MAEQKSSDVQLCEQWKEEGLKFLQKYAAPKKEWDTYQRAYEHDFSKDVVPINKYFSIMRSLVPRVYFRNPRVVVTPRKPGFYWRARLLEQIDNWLLREKHFKQEVKLMIQDCFLNGIGVGLIGYDNPAFSGESIPNENDKGEKFELNVNVKPGQPWFERCDPRDVIFPFETKNALDMPWFGQRVVKYTRDIKNHPLYGPNAKNLKGKSVPGYIKEDTDAGRRENFNEFDFQNTLWIFRNARTQEVMVMAEDHPKLLWKGPDALQIEGLPLAVLTFNPTGRSIYGIPDGRIILPQQELLNTINTMISTHAKLSIKKWLIDTDAIPPEEWDKAMNSIIGATLHGSNKGGRLADALVQFNLQIPPELLQLKESVEMDIREQIGFSRQSQGEFSPGGRKTATEVAAVDQALAIRIDERRDAVADILQQVVEKWNQYIFAFWDTPQVQAIVGSDNAPHWVEFTGAEIAGEYSYEIDPDDAMPVTGEMRKIEAQQIGQQLLNAAQLVPGMNVEEVIRQAMKHFSGWDVESILRPQGTPQMPQGAPMGLEQFEGQQTANEQGKPAEQMAGQIIEGMIGGGQ